MKTAVKAKKPLRVKGTQRQKKAIKELVASSSIKEAMVKAGYSERTARAPQKLTQSKGFMQLCDEIGLTNDLLVNSLTEDIVKKPQHRHKELELGFKVKGLLRDNIDITSQGEKISTQSYDRAREIIREHIRIGEGSDQSDLPEPVNPV